MVWRWERLEHSQYRNANMCSGWCSGWSTTNGTTELCCPSEKKPEPSYILSLLNPKCCCIPVWIHNLDQFIEANWAARLSRLAQLWLPLIEMGVLRVFKERIPQPLSPMFIKTKPRRNRFWKSEARIWEYLEKKYQWASTNTQSLLFCLHPM